MTERIRKCPDAPKWQARILANMAITPDGCWEWTGPLDRHGYGRFDIRIGAAKRMTGAHRAAWLAFEGEIEGDLVIDHLCRNTRCVNTAHLDLVSNAVNTLRADHSNKAGRSGRPRHLHGTEPHSCLRHGREDGYLIESGDGYARWTCRICRRERTARYRASRRKLTNNPSAGVQSGVS